MVGGDDDITLMLANVTHRMLASAHHNDTSSVLETDKVCGHGDSAAVITHDNPLNQSPLIIRGGIVMILAGYAGEHDGSNWYDQWPLSDPTQGAAA